MIDGRELTIKQTGGVVRTFYVSGQLINSKPAERVSDLQPKEEGGSRLVWIRNESGESWWRLTRFPGRLCHFGLQSKNRCDRFLWSSLCSPMLPPITGH